MTTTTTDLTIGLTGPDWEPTASQKFFAQRGTGKFAMGATEADALKALLALEAAEAPVPHVGQLFTVTGREEPIVGTGPRQPLPEMTLTLKQLKDARNELKTISFSDVGAIIHGLRLVIQKGHDDDLTAHSLLERLIRTTIIFGA